jgi:hypothetical protein
MIVISLYHIDEIIASVGIGNDEVTILSTLLNDSLYIINLSLYDG